MRGKIGFHNWLMRAVVVSGAAVLGMFLFSSPAFAIDVESPRVITISPKDSEHRRTVIVEADYDDDESGVDEPTVEVQVSRSIVSDCVKSYRKVSCKASNVEDGDHDVIVAVKDKYNNTASRSHRFHFVDNVAPVIDSIQANATEVNVSYHDPIPSSGIASVAVYVDGKRLSCGATGGGGCDNDHDGYDEDHNGYDEDRDDYDDDHDGYDDDHDGLDEDHDNYYHKSDGSRHESDGDYHDFDDDNDGAESSGYTCRIGEQLSCGPHQVQVYVTDKAGNVSTGSTTFDTGDCTPPVTTDNAPTGWQNTDVTVTLTCADTGSGCASTTYEVDAAATQYGNTVSLTTDGIHTITYRSTDNAGNVEATKTATVMIDKTPPAVTVLPDSQTVEATGPDGAVASYTASADDVLSGTTGPSCAPASGSTFPLGTTTVTCTATDGAGNTGTGSATITVVDTTAPAVIVLPDSQTVEATGPDGAVASYTASAADAVYGSPAVSCAPASGSTFPLGTTTVTCTAIDGAGNTGTGSATITVVDTTAPAVTYGGPTGTIITNDSPTITGAATDAVGVVSASVSIDGGAPTACTLDGLGNISCVTTGLAFGFHTVIITVSDAAGNTGTATDVFCKSSGRPNLMLYKVKGPYVVAGDPYRWVTIDYRMDNSGPDAYNVRMTSMLANNGIYLTSPMPSLGNIAPGGSVSFSVKYYWPVGVTSYLFTNTACAEDQCFTEYFYP